jgi:hypothetical protein
VLLAVTAIADRSLMPRHLHKAGRQGQRQRVVRVVLRVGKLAALAVARPAARRLQALRCRCRPWRSSREACGRACHAGWRPSRLRLKRRWSLKTRQPRPSQRRHSSRRRGQRWRRGRCRQRGRAVNQRLIRVSPPEGGRPMMRRPSPKDRVRSPCPSSYWYARACLTTRYSRRICLSAGRLIRQSASAVQEAIACHDGRRQL